MNESAVQILGFNGALRWYMHREQIARENFPSCKRAIEMADRGNADALEYVKMMGVDSFLL